MARILIIEDDEQVRSLLREVLEDSGHEVMESSNGEEGLKKFGLAPAAVVITDILMPGKEGLETIRDLRSESPGTKIIAISGGLPGSGLNLLDLARKLGASRILEKPFDIVDLVGAVNDVLID